MIGGKTGVDSSVAAAPSPFSGWASATAAGSSGVVDSASGVTSGSSAGAGFRRGGGGFGFGGMGLRVRGRGGEGGGGRFGIGAEGGAFLDDLGDQFLGLAAGRAVADRNDADLVLPTRSLRYTLASDRRFWGGWG